ncbi:MAG: YceI family protein [Saprospiraceae bacterium]|nr:YceI family protein [Saprospiraceae bacterium]
MKKLTIILSSLILAVHVYGQTYMTQNGTITFFSETPLENIEAINNQVSSAIDLSSGNIEAQALIKAFSFEKALMQQHFNERYLESHTYPKAKFEGKILNVESLELSDSPQEVQVEGQLSLHGVTRDLNTTATLQKTGADKIHGESLFYVKPADYEIEIPSGVRQKIAREIEVKIDFDLEEI